MKNQAKEQIVRASYAAPVCEEVPVWTEGTLCGSGDPSDGIGYNESIEETKGTW